MNGAVRSASPRRTLRRRRIAIYAFAGNLALLLAAGLALPYWMLDPPRWVYLVLVGLAVLLVGAELVVLRLQSPELEDAQLLARKAGDSREEFST